MKKVVPRMFYFGFLFFPLLLQGQSAIDILKGAQQKCLSIQSGSYTYVSRFKYFSNDEDTVYRRFQAEFVKTADDTLHHIYFHCRRFGADEWQGEWIYNGTSYINAWRTDSIGVVMNAKDRSWEIKANIGNCELFRPLTHQKASPLLFIEDDDIDSFKVKYLGVDTLRFQPCHRIYVCVFPENDVEEVMQEDSITYHFWICIKDSLPLRYDELFQVHIGKNAEQQYQLVDLLEYDLQKKYTARDFDSTSFFPFVHFKPYEPRKQLEPLEVGTTIPETDYPDLEGDTVRIREIPHKILLLDFYYKNCYPCLQAMPMLQSLYEKYKDRGLMIYGMDPFDEDAEDLKEFLKNNNVTYPTMLINRDVAKGFGVEAYPCLFLIDDQGKILYQQTGYGPSSEEKLEKVLSDYFEMQNTQNK